MHKKFPLELNHLDMQLIDLAFIEDLHSPYCDITTAQLFANMKRQHHARIFSKHNEPVVICGLPIVEKIFEKLDAHCRLKSAYCDGDTLLTGETLLNITGPTHCLLMAERIVLNFLQYLSAIATLTAKFVSTIQHTKAKILDTRKTLPGFRHLAKYAVHCGGGVNHRMGLYDAIMIKDTHIDFLNGIQKALDQLPNDITKKFPVIVEVRNQEECAIVMNEMNKKVTRILLDNMTIQEMKACVAMCENKIPTEASGNINLANIKTVAECGVDFISIGKLTHSPEAVDLSMQCEL